MKKHICLMIGAALLAACEHKETTINTPPGEKKETNTTIIKESPAPAKETNTTIVKESSPPPAKTETTTNVNVTTSPTP